MKKFYQLVFFICLAASDYAYSQDVAEVDAGQRLATSICSTCHIVSRNQLKSPELWPRAPNFLAIANHRSISDKELRRFLSSPHHASAKKRKMPELPLSNENIEQLIIYIKSLRQRP